jgi:hypothetical protein
MSLATGLAREFGVPLKMGAAAEELIRHYQITGYAKEDVLATVKELEKQTGTVLPQGNRRVYVTTVERNYR